MTLLTGAIKQARERMQRKERPLKIGILGSGDVAKSLARGFLKNGHEVMMGTRTAARLADWRQQNPRQKSAASQTLRSSATLRSLR